LRAATGGEAPYPIGLPTGDRRRQAGARLHQGQPLTIYELLGRRMAGSCGSHPQAVAGPDALAVMAFPGPLRLAEPLRQTDGASLNAAANEEPRLVEPAARADGGTCPRADRPYPERSQP
jgi:hypothetical protein